MNPPRSVRILGVPYKVWLAPHADAGCTGVEGQSLTVHPEQGPDQGRRTLLHECLHALFEGSGLGKWLGTAEAEEFVVSVLDSSLYQLLRQNPRLVEYLLEK